MRRPRPYETTSEVFLVVGRDPDDVLVLEDEGGQLWASNPAASPKEKALKRTVAALAKKAPAKKRKKVIHEIELPFGEYDDLRVQVGLVRKEGKFPAIQITQSRDIYELMKPLSSQGQEIFALVLLDTQNTVLGIAEVHRGGISEAVTDPRIILQYVLLANAVAVIAVHNHPSDSTKPSSADINLTNRLAELLIPIGVRLLDHVIVGSRSFTSLADEGRMP